jgi:pyruvate dehydrogenase complex dehydrogenase (E1) component
MTRTKFLQPMQKHESQRSTNCNLAKTVKGYGLSDEIEAVNKTHQIKKMQIDSLKYVRDRFNLPFTDEQLEEFHSIVQVKTLQK